MVWLERRREPARPGRSERASILGSGKTDKCPRALGKFLQDKAINDLAIMAPNYTRPAKKWFRGPQALLQGPHLDEYYTKFPAAGLPGEISQCARKNPEGGVRVLPGQEGIQLRSSTMQAGLREQTRFYRCSRVERRRSRAREEASGQLRGALWDSGPRHPASRRYVADFERKYGIRLVTTADRARLDPAHRLGGLGATKGNLEKNAKASRRQCTMEIQPIRGTLTVQEQTTPDSRTSTCCRQSKSDNRLASP